MHFWGWSKVVCFIHFKTLQYLNRVFKASPVSFAIIMTQGNKKLDKAEILEMTIEYLQRIQQQGIRPSGGNNSSWASQLLSEYTSIVPDLSQAQREWANEITTWIIQNKLLYSGPNAVDQFCNSLLLHLQNFGGQTAGNNTLQNIASVLLSQVSVCGMSIILAMYYCWSFH